MQKILITFALLFIAAFNSNGQTKTGTVIKIKDCRNSNEPKINWKDPAERAKYYADIAKHKHHDVEVSIYKGSSKWINYDISYYQKENDSIKNHKFGFSLDKAMDKAEYTWINDTLNIQVFKKENDKGKVYRGWGYGSTSSSSFDD